MMVETRNAVGMLLLAGTVALGLLPARAPAELIGATLVEDTYIASAGDAGSNYSEEAHVWMRNHSTKSRMGFLQFTLPQLSSGLEVSEVKLEAIMRDGVSTPVEVSGLSFNPDLTALTYNTAIASGSEQIITGLDGSYNFNYGATIGLFTEQTWSFAGTAGDPTSYVDTTVANGLLKFVRDNISTTEAVTITLGLGPTGDAGQNMAKPYSENDASHDAPQLILTVVPEPATAVYLVVLGLIALPLFGWQWRKRR